MYSLVKTPLAEHTLGSGTQFSRLPIHIGSENAILSANRSDRRKSPGVPVAGMVISVERPTDGVLHVIRLECPFPLCDMLIAANRQLKQTTHHFNDDQFQMNSG